MTSLLSLVIESMFSPYGKKYGCDRPWCGVSRILSRFLFYINSCRQNVAGQAKPAARPGCAVPGDDTSSRVQRLAPVSTRMPGKPCVKRNPLPTPNYIIVGYPLHTHAPTHARIRSCFCCFLLPVSWYQWDLRVECRREEVPGQRPFLCGWSNVILLDRKWTRGVYTCTRVRNWRKRCGLAFCRLDH